MAADRQRLAQALAAEAARRKMFESIPEAAGQGLPQAPERPMGWNDYLENLSIGLGRGAVNNLEGIKGMVTSPVETLKGVATGVTEAVRNPRMVAEALKQTGQRAMSGPLGFGEVIGENVNMMRIPGKPVMAELDVYHGTPHRFPATEANPLGEFDASKIGTGEGAQAYGHGIYLAENPRVAGEYQKMEANVLQSPVRTFKGQELQAGSPEYHAATLVDSMGLNKARKEVANWIATADPRMTREVEGWKQTLSTLNAATGKSDFKATASKGALYKADLPDEMIDRMLDWDKLIKDQPEAVRNAIDRIEREFGMRNQPYKNQEATGFWYGALTDTVGGQQNASKLLKEYGVPGIKYLDAGSRGQGGTGTRNFVVFPGEEKKVRILERDGQKAPPQKIAQALEAAPSKAAKAEPQPFGVQGYLNDDLRRVKQNFFSQYGVEENKQFSKDYEVVELAKLKPSENINESKIQSLMKTMREEGNARDNPIPPIIVDSEGNILDGHHRYEAAKRLGAKYVPIVELFDKRKGPVFSE